MAYVYFCIEIHHKHAFIAILRYRSRKVYIFFYVNVDLGIKFRIFLKYITVKITFHYASQENIFVNI